MPQGPKQPELQGWEPNEVQQTANEEEMVEDA